MVSSHCTNHRQLFYSSGRGSPCLINDVMNCCNANFNCALIRQLVSLLISPSAPCNRCQCKLDGPLSHYWKTCLYDNCSLHCINSNSHLASPTVAPQITGMHDTMSFCSYGMEKKLDYKANSAES